jgi:hypothetical protein
MGLPNSAGIVPAVLGSSRSQAISQLVVTDEGLAPNRASVSTASIPTHPLRIKTGSLATATSLVRDAF